MTNKEQYGHGLDSDHAEQLAEQADVTLAQAEATIIQFLVPVLDDFRVAAWDDAITNAEDRAVNEAEAKADTGNREVAQ
jgi:hypothetical protein